MPEGVGGEPTLPLPPQQARSVLAGWHQRACASKHCASKCSVSERCPNASISSLSIPLLFSVGAVLAGAVLTGASEASKCSTSESCANEHCPNASVGSLHLGWDNRGRERANASVGAVLAEAALAGASEVIRNNKPHQQLV